MEIEMFDLGLLDFGQAQGFQRQIFQAVRTGQLNNSLVVCRHSPVITQGRSAHRENILVSYQELKLRGIQVCEAERGGDVTYHGPGQLIVYPIFDLKHFRKDINFFLRYLEQVVIDFLADFAIIGERAPGFTGVWVDNKKIASIGIAVRNWITFHGLSINIERGDLDGFHLIKPCGMDIEMTCLETELGRNIEFNAVKSKFILNFSAAIDSQSKGVPIADFLPIWTKDVPVAH